MDVLITVTGPAGQQVGNEWHLRPGDLARAIGEALELYRKDYPDAPPFQQTIKVGHA